MLLLYYVLVSDVLYDEVYDDCISKLENYVSLMHNFEKEARGKLYLKRSSIVSTGLSLGEAIVTLGKQIDIMKRESQIRDKYNRDEIEKCLELVLNIEEFADNLPLKEHEIFKSSLIRRLEDLTKQKEQKRQRYAFESSHRNTSLRSSLKIRGKNIMTRLSSRNDPNGNVSKKKIRVSVSSSSSASSSSAPSSRRNSNNLDASVKIKYLTMYIAHINKHGLETEGLYRKNGNENRFKDLLDEVIVNEGDDCDETFSGVDIHTTAKFMKWLLRQSWDLLFTPDMEKNFSMLFQHENLDVESVAPKILDQLKLAMSSLKSENVYFLITFLRHLKEVASRSENNKMNSKNLATIFTPELLRSSMDEFNSDKPLQTWCKITQVLIDNHEYLFDLDNNSDVNKTSLPDEPLNV